MTAEEKFLNKQDIPSVVSSCGKRVASGDTYWISLRVTA